VKHTEDYQIAIDHTEKLLDRRQTITSFYLSVNTAIAAAIGIILKDGQLTGWSLTGALLLLMAMGFIACAIWRSLLRQYQIMLRWWFKQIRELEADRPDTAQLFSREYQELILGGVDRNAKPKAKIGLTSRELALNWVFTGLYGLLGVAIVIYAVWI